MKRPLRLAVVSASLLAGLFSGQSPGQVVPPPLRPGGPVARPKPPAQGAVHLAAQAPFSGKYLALRRRFLNDFFHDGQVAELAEGDLRKFSDQTLYMGFAFVTFAGEARLLKDAGHDPRPAEDVLRRLLRGFEALEKEAVRQRHRVTVPGFFLRDFATNDWPGRRVESGFLESAGNPGEDDMSLDQVVELMMGWWAVAHWSTDEGNRALAGAQADRALGFLMDERFMIDKPGTHSSVDRGDDARGAAGFLCHMGEQITGKDYYGRAKVRLTHDNKCHTCGGTGEVNIPDPNLECPACLGKGQCKIVVGGGRCEVCRGTGDVKLVTQSDCPACRGTGEIRVVATDPFGHDHTLGKSKCALCGGSGKVGGKTELGKCKVCHGSGRLPQTTKDLGRCKMCGGSGRIKGKLPRAKCPVCGGSKELNLYVRDLHPLVLGLEPGALVALAAPRLGLHKGKITLDGNNKSVAKPYVRHMNLVCLAFEKAVPDAALLAVARDSNHPWSVALRAAIDGTVCPSCHGQGKLFAMAPGVAHGSGLWHAPRPTLVRHELGTCPVCQGSGHATNGAGAGLIRQVAGDLQRLHRECPADGPSDASPSINWCKDNHWVRCTDLSRGQGQSRYNGLDFLSMEVLMRLAGAGQGLR